MSSSVALPHRRSLRAPRNVNAPVKVENVATTAGPSRRVPTNAAAGPSTPLSRPSRRSDQTTNATGIDATPDQTPPSGRRVLPARIRRAAGGGQEGIRELEEMIVDWLERWGLPCDTPPDSLCIHLTTLPLHLVHPPTFENESPPSQPIITLTPTKSQPAIPIPSPRRADLILDNTKIETPGWVIVKPGDDDAEEAREEMESRRKATSPLKRLRRLGPEEGGEDTSDAYYVALHKKYEVFERRQRIREKEKLNFERYKMKLRIELLRNMSDQSWTVVVNTVLSREGDKSWEKGRDVLREHGVDWLRDRLVKEGKELVKRYDQLLPVEPRKPNRASSVVTSTPTPERTLESSPRLTSSPAPVLPARVSALRDPASQKKTRSSPITRESPRKPPTPKVKVTKQEFLSEYDDPSILLPRKRKRPSDPNRSITFTQTKLNFVKIEPKPVEESLPPAPKEEREDSPISVYSLPSSRHSTPRSPSEPMTSFQSPSTVSGLPCLIEAASRREAAVQEAEAARAKVEARIEASNGGEKVSRFKAREKTRTSGRLGMVLPFGLPFPPVLEWKSEFTITDEEDFWGIIADREARAVLHRRSSVMNREEGSIEPRATPLVVDRIGSNGGPSLSKDDLADMKEVEAVVVL